MIISWRKGSLKKIIHLGYFHRYDDIRILKKECISLYKTGKYELIYITSNRNCEMRNEFYNGVKIDVLPLTDRRFIRLFKYIKDAYNKISEEEPDACHIHEFILFPIIKKLKRRNIKVILDLHENDVEDRSEQFSKKFGTFLGKIFHRFIIYYEKRAVLQSDAVISVTPQIVNRIKVYGKPSFLIPNYPQIDKSVYIKEKEYQGIKNFNVCFAGGISGIWNLENILEALAEIKNVSFLLAGRIEDKYLEILKKYPAWQKTKYYGVISHEDVKNKIYAESLIGLALLKYDVGWLGKDGTLGNTKIFEYMQAGLAVICTDFRLWNEIVDKHQCGIMVNPNSVEEVKSAINKLLNNPELIYKMGQNGKKAIEEEYNWDVVKFELIKLYETVLN